MLTERIAVAEGVELAVDVWTSPSRPGPRARSGAAGHDEQATIPFLLVHGLASNARLWDGVAEQLAAAGQLPVTVDLRGHGRSSKPDGPYDVPTVAGDLANLIRALPLDRPVVAGQSWGGNVALELGARDPELVRAVVCVDGGWLEPSRTFADWEACRTALAPPRLVGMPRTAIEARIRSAHPDWPESGIRGALANFEVRADGTVAPWLTFDRHIAVLRGLWDDHPSERYGSVGMPVLLVPVESDDGEWTRRKRRDVEAALAALPDGRVRWFRGDHDIHAQHPAELADVMLTMTTATGVSR
jgi:pimeloyl-ACP methyl ester carboxylesterase